MRRQDLEKDWPVLSVVQIANKYKTTRATVYSRARMWGLPSRSERQDDDNESSPSPEEIAERAAEVRRGWTGQERASRLVGSSRSPRRWTVPEIRIGEIEAPSFSRI